MDSSPPPAGWYRDPARRFDHRYWNGTAWTTHVMIDGVRLIDGVHTIDDDDRAPEPARAVERQVSARPRWPILVWVLVLGGAVLLVIGATLPWAEAQDATSSFTQDGIATDGAITIVVAALIALAFIVVPGPVLAAACVVGGALVAGAIGARYAIDTSSKAADLVDRSPPGTSAGVGVGVWVTLAAAGIVLIGGIAAFVVASRSWGRSDA